MRSDRVIALGLISAIIIVCNTMAIAHPPSLSGPSGSYIRSKDLVDSSLTQDVIVEEGTDPAAPILEFDINATYHRILRNDQVGCSLSVLDRNSYPCFLRLPHPWPQSSPSQS